MARVNVPEFHLVSNTNKCKAIAGRGDIEPWVVNTPLYKLPEIQFVNLLLVMIMGACNE